MSFPRSPVAHFALATLVYLLSALPTLADSNVRAVRLSQVEGKVQVDRGGGEGYEKAIVNLPITQGVTLNCPSESRAEVELEDGSTIRLTPDSAVDFRELSLRDGGGKNSRIELLKGTAYINFGGARNDEFAIQFGEEKIQLTHRARLRINLGNRNASVAVFSGAIPLSGPWGSIEVGKRETANLDLTDQDRPQLVNNIQPEPLDTWDREQEQYERQHPYRTYSNYSPYAYGTRDLIYYGNFFSVPGYGMMWQPYFVGLGWDPFMDGAWAFSPGWGYGWVSAYPWGWLPYHCGSWILVPGFGWMWQPGGVWTTWYKQPRIANAPAGFVLPKPPSSGTSTVAVSRSPSSEVGSGNKLVVRSNSAGLGIPRGRFGDLRRLSEKAQGQLISASHPGLVSSVDASRPVPQMSRGASTPAPHSGASSRSPGTVRH